ncbi:MAG: SRPBCC family protein [Pseudomonadota bacterium]|nr:SRPBCC family protein [Pseudomonadota bacterium]
MVARHSPGTGQGARTIVTTRVFDAPRELVFEAWTNPKHLVQWWGPNGFTTTIRAIDVRPDGVWRFVMHGPDGVDYENRIVYNEIVKPERLVYSHGGGGDVEPVQFQVTVTFEDQAAKPSSKGLFPSAAERDRVAEKYGAVEGAKQTLERLAEHLATMG